MFRPRKNINIIKSTFLLYLLLATHGFIIPINNKRTAWPKRNHHQYHHHHHHDTNIIIIVQHNTGFTQFQLFAADTPSLSSSSSTSSLSPNNVKAPYPKVGDVVRYEDLDGGKSNGQVLTGRISLIQEVLPSSSSSSITSSSDTHEESTSTSTSRQWIAEITQLDDLGDGYYTDFSFRKRASKRVLRPITVLTPLPASFVRTEMAWKVPKTPLFLNYNLIGYKGPQMEAKKDKLLSSSSSMILDQDKKAYNALKIQLIQQTTWFGLGGTVVVQLLKGMDDAFIYLAGALAGVGYLFFLSVKTDTIGISSSSSGNNGGTSSTPQTLQGLKQGNKIANIRFLLPLVVLLGVAIRNASLFPSSIEWNGNELSTTTTSLSSTITSINLLHTVTPEQFGAAMLGFLTYRIPLILYQLGPAIADAIGIQQKNKEQVYDGVGGSLGIALQMAQGTGSTSTTTASSSMTRNKKNLQTILLVSGPSGTGKTTLVQKFLSSTFTQHQESHNNNNNNDDDDKNKQQHLFATPKYVDRYAEPVTFERLNSRGEFLYIDPTGRFGLTLDGIRKPSISKSSSSSSSTKMDMNAKNHPSFSTGLAVAANDDMSLLKPIVVVDASVELAKKLTQVPGIRIVGVWVGLDSLEKFEQRIKAQIKSGQIYVGPDESPETVLRGEIRQIVKDIEYGIVSGIFEFTILNEDIEVSLEQLKKAAAYCLVD